MAILKLVMLNARGMLPRLSQHFVMTHRMQKQVKETTDNISQHMVWYSTLHAVAWLLSAPGNNPPLISHIG